MSKRVAGGRDKDERHYKWSAMKQCRVYMLRQDIILYRMAAAATLQKGA